MSCYELFVRRRNKIVWLLKLGLGLVKDRTHQSLGSGLPSTLLESDYLTQRNPMAQLALLELVALRKLLRSQAAEWT